MRRAAVLLLSLSLVQGLAIGAVGASLAWTGTAAAQSPTPSPSDPPFWARPRPAQPAPAAECDCPGTGGDASPSDGISPLTLFIAIGGLALLFLLWRWTRPTPAPAAPRPTAPAAAATAARSPEPAAPRRAPPPAPRTPPSRPPEPALAPMEPPDGRPERIELVESGEEPTTAESLKFYRDVANSLSEAIEKHPERQDLWRKLFEVYSTAKMPGEFVNLAYAFLERHGGAANPHWREIGVMGCSLVPEHELFREFGEKKSSARRTLQFRRYYDRQLDQGALFRAQEKLEAAFSAVRQRPEFQALLRRALADGAQRPSPVAPVPLIDLGDQGARIFLKREDRRRANDEILINAIGQVMLAQHLGLHQVVTATRDGTHALATATVAARLGMECAVYIAESDLRAHYSRVLALRKLGAHVRPVRTDEESRFHDARQYALTDWIEHPEQSQYICGLSGGPQPFPMIVGELQAVVGHEAAEQMQRLTGGLPGAVLSHARDGYFGMGLLRGFLDHPAVKLYYLDAPDPDLGDADNARALFLREHRWLRDTGRVLYMDGNDSEGMRLIEQFHSSGTSLHAATGRTLAQARQIALQSGPGETVLVAYSAQEDDDLRDAGADV